DRAPGAAMRLLPIRHDHGGGGAPCRDTQACRCRHRCGGDQYLSMRHLRAHPRGGQSTQRGEKGMSLRLPLALAAALILTFAESTGRAQTSNVESQALFSRIATVLKSPQCMNCHTDAA